MIECPHCGKMIDAANTGGWWRYDRGGPVSLGCGTLIVIALIVAIFSKGGIDKDDFRELQRQIRSLDEKIDKLPRIEVRPVAEQEPAK